MNAPIDPGLWQEAQRRGLRPDGCLLVAEVAGQRLTLIQGGAPKQSFAISTSRLGLGNREDSHQTPPGWHAVVERYGAGLALGAVFLARRPTGEVLPAERWGGGDERDLILSRILRLAGLEEGRNCGPGVDSYRRFIYLHGTNHEALLGQPASGGCIRMANRDIAELFQAIEGRMAWCLIV